MSEQPDGFCTNHKWRDYYTGDQHTHDICANCNKKREAMPSHSYVDELEHRIKELKAEVSRLNVIIEDSRKQEPVAVVIRGVVQWKWCKQFDHGELFAHPVIKE